MRRKRIERPIFWIIAGPNGSGKTSAYDDLKIETSTRSIWIINPDLLSVRIAQIEKLSPAKANLAAVRRIEAWLEASIEAYQTVGVETVLSTSKYRRLVKAAKARGFEIRLTYVLLDSPDRNVERVKIRVRKGGHDVPEAKIRERYDRSLRQLPWFLGQADEVRIFDNSGADPRLIGEKGNGVITLVPAALPQIIAAAKKIAG